MGASSCSDTLAFSITQVDTLPTLNLEFTVENIDTVLLKEPLVMEYDSFNVPILSLGAPPAFCEGEPINVTFDATVQGAVSYAWSTGETTPMITVTEEGMYTVEVRVEEDVCFTLCDTTMITVTGPPEVAIDNDFSTMCTLGFGTLTAEISGAANSIEWSTGETNQESIQVSEFDTYFVTVTNQCGSSTDSHVFDGFLEIPPGAGIITDTSGLCLGANATLTATGAFINDVLWSTPDGIINGNETSPTIALGAPGTYILMTTNLCGENMNQVTVFGEVPMLNLTIDAEADSLCAGGSTTLVASGLNFLQSGLSWSTGVDSSFTISVDEEDIYTVTASNDCFSSTASIELNCVFPFDECLFVPNAFTPNGDDANDGFSGVVMEECLGGIIVNRLSIWSRWGKKVFDQVGPDPQWDGTIDGEPATADVYIYRLEASTDDETVVREGDVTLIR